MSRFILIGVFLIATAPVSNAQTSISGAGRENNREEAPHEDHTITRSRASLVISRIDEQVVREFRRAWDKSMHGILSTEAVVLIFRMPDGSIRAVPGGYTNEAYRFTFGWNQAIFAIVHTHPNKSDPKPQGSDLLIADKFGTPIFTITLSGMYLYDPATKKIAKVQDDLNWLKPTSWARYSHLLNSQIASQ